MSAMSDSRVPYWCDQLSCASLIAPEYHPEPSTAPMVLAPLRMSGVMSKVLYMKR